MKTAEMTIEDLTLDVEQQIEIKAPPEKVFRPCWNALASATPVPAVNHCT